MKVEPIAGVTEDLFDVCREVREGVTGATPSVAAGVDESTPVRMDQAAEQQAWDEVDQFPLPGRQHDLAFVLLPGAVLGQKTRPRLGVCVNLDVILRSRLQMHLVPRDNRSMAEAHSSMMPGYFMSSAIRSRKTPLAPDEMQPSPRYRPRR
jgi:hypothetical protein